MTNKERFMTALKLDGEPDMVPIWELALNEICIINIAKHFTDNVPEHKLLHEMTPDDLLAIFKALVTIATELDFDGITAPTTPKTEYLGDNVIEDSFGIKHKLSDHGMAVPIAGPIGSMDDLKAYKLPKIDESWVMAAQLGKSFVGEKRAVVLFFLDVFDLAWSLRGNMTNLLMDYAANPELAHAVSRVATDAVLQLADVALNAEIDMLISTGDIAMNEAPLMSPTHFKEFLKPYYKEVIDYVHSRGGIITKHSDGNLNPILDDLLDLGFDGLHPIQPQCMDIGDTKKRVAGKMCLMGNIDCVDLLTTGTEEEVEQVVKETIQIAAPGGGYILSSSNTIHQDVKPENAIAMYRAARKHGKY